jgi:predicted transcriptional regulator
VHWATALPIFRSELQARLLGILLLNADRTWTSADLAVRLEATSVSVHRELQRALRAGLLSREAVGRTYLYRAATDSPLFEPLRLLLERTVGIEADLRKALREVPGLEAAFVHGSFAKSAGIRPVSDVDVLVLGDIDYSALRKRIRPIERRAGREIDLLAYGREEFASLARSGNALAKSVLDGPLTTLVGSPEILEDLAVA